MRKFDLIDFTIVLFLLGVGLVAMAVATEDTTAPVLTSFSFSPATITTTSGPQVVTINATITDDLSGFDQMMLCFRAPLSGQSVMLTFNSGNRISGTATSGTYQATATFQQYVKNGNWKLTTGALQDAVGNVSILNLGNAAFGIYSTLRTQ
jgi:hypothetical protein